ncbi:protein FAM217A-like isoform X2 [Sceloporus undulatus]|uniref:protein FAM217A-like isoform X2 n=1 Tax=Sceloporus undulatus TaxID=8520 RepID=UPI001C4AE998|nr:protein FAM217A-like isoform X2 [Sceloporus undulatus]
MRPSKAWPSPASSPVAGNGGGFPGLSKGSKTSKPANVVEKKDCLFGVYGTSYPLNSFSHQIPGTSGLESDCSAEKKSSLPKNKIGAGGALANTIYKDFYKDAIEQLADLSFSNNPRTAQYSLNSGKQGSFQSESCTHNHGNNSVIRDLNIPFIQMPSNSSHVLTNFIHTNPLVRSFTKRCSSVSSSGTQKTLENSHRNGSGDLYKSGNETSVSGSCTSTDSGSDGIPSTFKRKLKRGNDNIEATLPIEEKDTPESEQRNKTLLNFLKNINTNLKPDPIEHKEDVSAASENMFSYPDFLPPPYNTLDLQKLSKLDDWRLGVAEPLDQPFDLLISRLVRMERLQYLTILKEKTKESVSPAVAVNSHSSSSKDIHQPKQPRSSGLPCSQTSFDGDLYNFGCCVHEPDIPKCTSQRYRKWTSGGLSPTRSTTCHPRASCNMSKYRKALATADSTNTVAQRSILCCGSTSKIETDAKISSQKLLSSDTAVCSSLRDNESSKYKQRKRKPCRTNGTAVTGRLINSPSHTNQ